MRGSAAMWRRPPIHSGRHRPGASCFTSRTKRATSRLASSIRPPLIQKRWCGWATSTASMLPTAGPMVWPTIAPDWANDSALPMRPGGVFATSSAMPAGTTPLKKPIMREEEREPERRRGERHHEHEDAHAERRAQHHELAAVVVGDAAPDRVRHEADHVEGEHHVAHPGLQVLAARRGCAPSAAGTETRPRSRCRTAGC